MLLAVALLVGCGGGGNQRTQSQATTQPPQSTTPSVVEQPDSGGPILSDDARTAMTGDEVPPDEGPLRRVHFAYDAHEINGESQPILSGNAQYLQQNSGTFIRIEGHCDERGSVEYNQALGERRANSAKEFLVAQGIEANRLETISFGEDRPLSFDHNEYAWALNRRAEFRILSE
jgi:peptidoglycan-associated lipoprotein